MALNRNFYAFAVFISTLFAAVTFIQGIIYFLLGQQVYSLAIFFLWYVFGSGLSLLGALVFLRYFHVKTFYPAFWTMLLVTIASLIQFSVGFSAFLGIRGLMSYYMSTHMLLVGANILFGLALIFSNAGKKYWLKLTGIFSVLISVFLMAVALWYIISPTNQNLLTLQQIYKWPTLIACIGPILMMMNFLSEQKQWHQGEGSVPSQKLDNLMAVTRVVALFAALFLGLKVTTEALTRLSFESEVERKEREWETVWGSRTFVNAKGETLKYQLITPLDFDPTKKYPMVVCLPYGGGVEGAPPAKLLLAETNRKKYPSFLFVPFCSKGSGWGGIPNYPTMDTLVFESIEALEKELNEIDVNRIYVTGVSRGGYGSWHFISLRPDLFAAAMPVCGGGDPNVPPNIVDVDVWAFHGEDDPNVPVSGSRDMIAAIKKSGGNPKYTEFEGAGHDIWDYVTKTPGVLDWMFEQKREK